MNRPFCSQNAGLRHHRIFHSQHTGRSTEAHIHRLSEIGLRPGLVQERSFPSSQAGAATSTARGRRRSARSRDAAELTSCSFTCFPVPGAWGRSARKRSDGSKAGYGRTRRGRGHVGIATCVLPGYQSSHAPAQIADSAAGNGYCNEETYYKSIQRRSASVAGSSGQQDTRRTPYSRSRCRKGDRAQ